MTVLNNECPTCQTRFDPAKSAALPFCSNRCRQIDLGRWLDEEYGVPWEATGDNEESLEESLEDSPRRHQ